MVIQSTSCENKSSQLSGWLCLIVNLAQPRITRFLIKNYPYRIRYIQYRYVVKSLGILYIKLVDTERQAYWAGIPELQKSIKTNLNIGKQTRYIKIPYIYSSLPLTVDGIQLAV